MSAQLVAAEKPLEARHFGYGVLQHVVGKRWREFSDDEKSALAKMCYEKLGEISSGVKPEPFVLKSKVATVMAQVVRQQGAETWRALAPDLAAGAAAENPALAEVSCLTTRYVAEDVAVHNEDIIGGRMKELLFGLTSTLPQTLPALYRSLEVRSRLVFFGFSGFFGFGFLLARAPPRASALPMTKQPLRINHPNIHHVVYFLTLLPRQRARAPTRRRRRASVSLRSAPRPSRDASPGCFFPFF